MGVNTEKYASKINKICEMFNLTIDGETIRGILGEYETHQTFVHLSNFLIGISHIATLKYFD